MRGGNELIVWDGCKDFGQAELRMGMRKYGETLLKFSEKFNIRGLEL
jgi:hypothetical protein